MKRVTVLISLMILFSLMINIALFDVCAETPVEISFSVSRQIQKGKSVPAQIELKTSAPVSVLHFSIVLGDGLEYTSCQLCENISGKILTAYENNHLNILLINAQGLHFPTFTDVITVRLKSVSDTVGSTGIQVGILQGTDINENLIPDTFQHYDVDIVEKITDNARATQAAVSRSSDNSSSKSTVTPKANNQKSVPANKSTITAVPDFTETGTEYQLSTASVHTVMQDNKKYSVITFAAGGIFVLGITLVIFISYKYGKSHAG